jgi:hypothetical protein
MAVLAIEINDAAVTVAGVAGNMISSPGFALIEAGGVSFGETAARRALLQPSRINHRFWERLSSEPITQPVGHNLTYSDLAHGHLQQLWRELGEPGDEVVLVTPSDYSLAQLSHLAGISQALQIPVRAVVDAALAASSRLQPGGGTWLHLDAQLHRALLVQIAPGGVRTEVSVVHGLGLTTVQHVLTRTAARRFLQTSRFDPLHQGQSEQALHDQIPDLLRQLDTGEHANLTLEAGGHRYQTQLHRSDLVDALADLRRQLVGLVSSRLEPAAPFPVAVGQRLAAHVPGLIDDLLALGTRVEVLAPAAAVSGALANYPRLLRDPDALRLTTRLDSDGQLP